MRAWPVKPEWRWPLVAGLVTVLVAAALAGRSSYDSFRAQQALKEKLGTLAPVRLSEAVDCRTLAPGRALVLLALGQSNAANHGSPVDASAPLLPMLTADGCMLARQPVPGATGEGGSVWPPMVQALQAMVPTRPVLVSVLAVDATSIADWTRDDSPLAQRLLAQLRHIGARGFKPDLVLWQQGEADARAGTPPEAYLASLHALARLLDTAGVAAPIVLARSTVCRTPPSQAVRLAIEQAAGANTRFLEGPDTDQWAGVDHRRDGCHFNRAGLDVAGKAWAQTVASWVKVDEGRR